MIATVQRGLKVLSTSALTDTDTIPTEVNTANAFLSITFRTSGGTEGRQKRRSWNAKITSGTQITFERLDNGDAGVATTCAWEVTEFASGEAVVQKNATAENPTADPLSVTISAVVIARSIVVWNFATAQDTPVAGNTPTAYFPDTTHIEFDCFGTPLSNDWKAFWAVVEFNSGDATVQSSTITISGTTLSVTAAPGTNFGSTAATVLVLSHRAAVESDVYSRTLLRLRATAVGELTLDRGNPIGSGTGTITARYHALEFLDGTTVQYVDADMVGASSAAPSISAVTIARSMLLSSGWQNAKRDHSVTIQEPQSFATLELASTAVTATRTSATGNLYVPCYVIQFEAAGGAGATPKGVFGKALHGPLRRAVY